MTHRPDPALDELKRAAAQLLDGHPVVVSASRTGDGSKECLVLTVEPARGPCRYLRIHATDAPQSQSRYACCGARIARRNSVTTATVAVLVICNALSS